MSTPPLPPDGPPDDEFAEFEQPEGTEPIPLGRREDLPEEEHPSFNEFWESLDMGVETETLRLAELFYEWLGQNGYDVHLRDEPTVIGDRQAWLQVWSRYLKQRRLT